jgi:uncharacterized FlaG/YvyC family protein
MDVNGTAVVAMTTTVGVSAQSTPAKTQPYGPEGLATSTSGSADSLSVNKAHSETIMQQLNQKLYPQGLEAKFQFDRTSHMTWINVVNKATGQVVDKYPPEAVRQLMDKVDAQATKNLTNLSFDAYA